MAEDRNRNQTSHRGFAAMEPEKQRAIARKGGESVPNEKRSFSQNHELASQAGRKGGQASHGGGRRTARPRQGEEDGASLAGGSGDGLFVINEDVFELGGGHVGARVIEEKFVFKLHERVAAVARGGRLSDVPGGGDSAVAGEVIPHHFEPAGGQREGDAGDRVFEGVAVVRQSAGGGIGLGGVVDALRGVGAATSGVDDEFIVGVRFEERDRAGGEFGFVLA